MEKILKVLKYFYLRSMSERTAVTENEPTHPHWQYYVGYEPVSYTHLTLPTILRV